MPARNLAGMENAWITQLHRIQNRDLYTYYDIQRRRLLGQSGTTQDGKVAVTEAWHGTGSGDAANIYSDTQDGFMSATHAACLALSYSSRPMRRVLVAVQFSSNAQWGRGLYFARDAVSSADARGRNQLASSEILCMLLTGLLRLLRDESDERRARHAR